MKYLSHAEWPEGVCRDMFGKPHSQDTHESEEAAEKICRLLEREGYAGQGEYFPIRTWTEPETAEIAREEARHQNQIIHAADLAVKGLKAGWHGRAITEASKATGITIKEIEAELTRRRVENKKRKDAQRNRQ